MKESVHLVEENSQEEESDITENVLLSSGEFVLMQTPKTKVNNPITNSQQTIRLQLDTGSQRTYVTDSLAKSLNLKMGEPNDITLVTFGSKKPQRIKSPSTLIGITLINGSTLQINANVIPSITGTVFRGPIHLGSLQKGDKFLDQFTSAFKG